MTLQDQRSSLGCHDLSQIRIKQKYAASIYVNTKMAHRQLQIYADSQLLKRSSTLKYSPQNAAGKLKTGNNKIHKLCGTAWV